MTFSPKLLTFVIQPSPSAASRLHWEEFRSWSWECPGDTSDKFHLNYRDDDVIYLDVVSSLMKIIETFQCIQEGNLELTGRSSVLTNCTLRSTWTMAILTSSSASRLPIHRRGPNPKARKEMGFMLALFSVKNLRYSLTNLFEIGNEDNIRVNFNEIWYWYIPVYCLHCFNK